MPTVLLPGWGNSVCSLNKLKEKINNSCVFDYTYGNNCNVFKNFDEMNEVFDKFISNEINPDDELNIIGYSQGGIIAIYYFGIHETRINKYVSIASPHCGAFGEKWNSWGNTGGVTYDFTWNSDFMTRKYPEASEKFFKLNHKKENILQIWSDEDKIAIPESSKRFVDMNLMSDCEIEYQRKSTLDQETSENIDRFFSKLSDDLKKPTKGMRDIVNGNYNKKLLTKIKSDTNHLSMPLSDVVVDHIVRFL